MSSSIPREYESCGLLGQGAISVVYRARHLPSGRLVALKCLKMPRAVLLPLVRREVQALRRLRHPGVVRILDSGTQDGVPWYSMELIEGPTLREWLQPLGLAERLGPLLDLVSGLCEALAYVHGEGIVHRDLKPENVLVSADRRPVLVDFGFVTEFAAGLPRESLNLDSGAHGTPLYMAPEQIQGELVDARADLYSLGCLLYELLSGQPVFTGTAQEVREAHLGHAPRPLRELAPWVPEALDELVGRLLRKDRRERYGYATDVAGTLVGLGAGRTAAGPEPRPYLYRPSFVGRRQVLEQLDACLAQLEGGLGGVVLLAGESGGGKTRLLIELGRRAMKRKLRVLVGECPPDGVRALEVLRKPLQTLADWCRQQGRDATLRLLGSGGRLLGRYEPQLLELDGVRQAPETAELPAEAARVRLFDALDQAFGTWAEERPLLLALDDLHWADELSLGWVEHFWGARRWPLLVVGAYRPEDLGAQKAAPLKRLLERLAAGGEASVQLGRLEPEALDSMASDMLALETISAPFAAFLQRQTNGNPLFLGEYLRTAVAEDVLYRDGQGRWQVSEPGDAQATAGVFESLPLPGGLRELLARRLQGLGATARAVVDCAAVLGRESEEALLGRMMRAGAEKRLEAARELLARQVMEESGAGRLRFAHDKLREVAYERLAKDRQVRLHRAAAEAIEAHHGPESAEHQAALGHHWQQAGVPGKAALCYLAAARGSAAQFALAEAERHYRASLSLDLPLSADRALAQRELAWILRSQGRASETMSAMRPALEQARALGDRLGEAESLRMLGVLWSEANLPDQALAAYEQSRDIARQLGDQRLEAMCLNSLAILHKHQDHIEQARGLYHEALELLRESVHQNLAADIRGNLALLQAEQGEVQQARSLLHEVLSFARGIGQPDLEVYTLLNLGVLEQDQGWFERSQELSEQALVLGRQKAYRVEEGLILLSLGNALFCQGRVPEAEAVYEQALGVQRRLGVRRYEGPILFRMGTLRFDQGRPQEAQVLLEQSLDLAREVRSTLFEGDALIELAGLERLARGDLERAEASILQAAAIFEQVRTSISLGSFHCGRGHIELALGREGRPFLERAQEIALTLQVLPVSELGQAIGRLERAVAAFEAGRPLFRGQLREDLSEGLRRWLEQQGMDLGQG